MAFPNRMGHNAVTPVRDPRTIVSPKGVKMLQIAESLEPKQMLKALRALKRGDFSIRSIAAMSLTFC